MNYKSNFLIVLKIWIVFLSMSCLYASSLKVCDLCDDLLQHVGSFIDSSNPDDLFLLSKREGSMFYEGCVRQTPLTLNFSRLDQVTSFEQFCKSRRLDQKTVHVKFDNFFAHMKKFSTFINDNTCICQVEITQLLKRKKLKKMSKIIKRKGINWCVQLSLQNKEESLELIKSFFSGHSIHAISLVGSSQECKEELKNLLMMEVFKDVEVFVLWDSILKKHDITLLSQESTIQKFKTFNISNSPLEESFVNSIHESPKFTPLEKLGLNGCNLSFIQLEKLVNTCFFPNLVELCLSGNALTDEGVEILCSKTGVGRLRKLLLNSNDLTARSVKCLCSCPKFRNLLHLELSYNLLDDDAMTYLSQPYNLSNLESVDLSFNRITDQGVSALCSKSVSQSWKNVNLSGNQLSELGAQSLSSSPNFECLEKLNLSKTAIYFEGALSIIQSNQLLSLEQLEISQSYLSLKDIWRLRNQAHETQLELIFDHPQEFFFDEVI